jgi:hypothetical protein
MNVSIQGRQLASQETTCTEKRLRDAEKPFFSTKPHNTYLHAVVVVYFFINKNVHLQKFGVYAQPVLKKCAIIQ